MDKKSIVNDLYQAAVISVLAVGYSMPGKTLLKMTPPSVQKFDLEDTEKLVANVAASKMTREYLIKQKILPDHINVSFTHLIPDTNTRMATLKLSLPFRQSCLG